MEQGCDFEAGNLSGISSDVCETQWSCFDQHFEIDCLREDTGALCTCLSDDVIVGSFERSDLPNCESDETAYACGFPPLSFAGP